MDMNQSASGNGMSLGDSPSSTPRYYDRDFWSVENLNYVRPHLRLEKSARIINKLARRKECTLLDVGCGPATLMHLLDKNIHYHGIDIAIHDPAPNLIQANLLESPVKFGNKQFDIVIAQGFFEYVGEFHDQKLAEIARLLNRNGTFIVSYVNFGHRKAHIYQPYSNIRSIEDFRKGLRRYFDVNTFFPTSHNWNHIESKRKLIKAVNILNVNVPFISPVLAVEYFFICSSRQ
jgi:SAM-dependent methyltransferase